MATRAREYRWLVFFLITSALFLGNSFRIEAQQTTQNALLSKVASTQAQITTNDARIADGIYSACIARNDAAKGTNVVLSSLIAAVTVTESLGDVEKKARLEMYEKAKVPMTVCERSER